MKKGLLAVVALLILLLIALLIWNANQRAATPNPGNSDVIDVIEDNGNDTPDGGVVAVPDDSEESADPAEDTADGTGIDDEPAISEEANIRVTLPDDGQKVGVTGMVIVGEARVYENTVEYRVRDASGAVIDSGFTTAGATDIGQFGPFVIYSDYSATAGQTGLVEVFATSARDGSEIELVSIPVRFVAEREISVYFGSAVTTGSCAEVKSVKRLIPAGVSRDYTFASAVWAWLEGVTATEAASNYSHPIDNTHVRINSLTVVDGVVRVDFSEEIEQGGSCRVTAIRAQLNELFEQFFFVNDIIITVEGGDPSEALQP